HSSSSHWPPSFVKARTSLSVALSILLTVSPVHAQGLPDLGDASSATLSETQERTIGNRIMREIRVDPLYVDDPEVADYITSLGERLLMGVDGPRRELTFF